MRLRIRGPSGQFTVALADGATVGDLRNQIIDKTGLTSYDVKYGYPVQSLSLDQFETHQSLTELGVQLNGEQLIITSREGVAAAEPVTRNDAIPQAPQKLSLSRKQNERIADDPPVIPSPEHGGVFVLRVMPDDNSCLFRAVSTAILGIDTMTELRSIVAETIRDHPDEYPEVVLEKKPEDYCHWIQQEDSWGGAIELSILSKHFGYEICSIDVKGLRVDRFNEGQERRCILVYSGIHYDTIAVTVSPDALPDRDTKIFDAQDPLVLERSLDLCKRLQNMGYYTDTAGFRIRCNTCGGIFVGEKGATKHAEQTGHVDFGEAE